MLVSVALQFGAGEGSLKAQSVWFRSSGGNANEEALGITKYSADKIALTGYFTQSGVYGDSPLSSQGADDIFVQANTIDGVPLWSLSCGGQGPDRGTAITHEPSGAILVAGTYSQTASFGNTNLTAVGDSLDVFVMKVSAGGEILWVASAGGEGNDLVHGINADGDGNILISGQFRGVCGFGGIEVESDLYEGSTEYSYDGFVAKLDANGNWQWVQTASGVGDNRFLDVDTGPQGAVYAVGEFSEDLTVDVLHESDELNAGMLVKLSAAGEELWFRKMGAAQVTPNQVAYTVDNAVAVSGMSSGLFTLFDDASSPEPFLPGQNVFALKVDPEQGQRIWHTAYHSLNALQSHDMDTGPTGELYLSGTFRCSFTGRADAIGEAAFYSMGFRDVFTARVSAGGEKEWNHHYAGPGDDSCFGLCVGEEDEVYIAGAFQRFFHMSRGQEYTEYPENDLDDFDFLFANNAGYCNDPGYGDVLSMRVSGNSENTREVYYARAFHESMPLLDYHDREGEGCELPLLPWCAWNDVTQSCTDSIVACEDAILSVQDYAGTQGVIGPLIEVEWTHQYTELQGNTDGTGWNYMVASRVDGCYSTTDSVYFELLDLPEDPLVSDELGINVQSADPEDITICADSVLLWAEGCDECEVYWLYQGNQNDSLMVVSSGLYLAVSVGPSGCQEYTSIRVTLVDEEELLGDPQELLAFHQGQTYGTGDTLTICQSELVTFMLSPVPEYLYGDISSLWDFYFNDEFQSTTDVEDWEIAISPQNTGLYTYEVAPIDGISSVCQEEYEELPPLLAEFYIIVNQGPNTSVSLTQEPLPVCPGDTATVVMSLTEGASYTYSGQGIVSHPTDTIFLLESDGTISIEASAVSEEGCSSIDFANLNVEVEPAPVAVMIPEDGVICPGDSVMLDVTPGVEYSWSGPLGFEVSDEQVLYADVPGFYSCSVVSENGCEQTSNMLELRQYMTPFLLANPGTTVCADEPVAVEVVTNYPEGFTWLPPLSGNSLLVVIDEPGIYGAVSSACGITSAMEVEIIYSEIEVAITGGDQTICLGDTATLSVSGNAVAYAWLPGNVNGATLDVTEEGSYVVVATDTLACSTSDTVYVDVLSLELPISQDYVVCPNDTLNLAAEAADANVSWWATADADSLLQVGNSYTIAPVTEEQTLYVQSVQQPCVSALLPVEISFSSGSVTPEAALLDSICVGGSTLLTAEAEGEALLQWYDQNDSLIVAGDDGSLWLDEVTVDHQGWYYVEAFDSLCSSEPDSVFLEVFTAPVQALTVSADSLCEGESFQLTIDLEAQDYFWNTPSGIVETGSPVLSIPSVVVEDSGEYGLEVQGAACAFSMNTHSLYVGAYPELLLGDDQVKCVGAFAVLDPQGEAENYLWNTGDTLPSLVLDTPGLLTLEAWNAPGCAVFLDYDLEDIDCDGGFINIFTPNGDGVNDVIDFGIYPGNLIWVRIYNRWGHLMRELSGDVLLWNGVDNQGDRVSDGTYYWIGAGQQGGRMRGYVTVKR